MLNRVPLARCHLIESIIRGSPQYGPFVSSRALPSARAAVAPMLRRLTELMSRRLIAPIGNGGGGNCSIGLLDSTAKTMNSTFQQPKVIATATSLGCRTIINPVRTFTRGPVGMGDTTESGSQRPLPNGDLNYNLEMQEYNRAISDLNSLQSNTQVLALAKYKQPETILPLFRKQMRLAGIEPEQLNKLNAIHVSGTKGKGSTCAFLESILRQQKSNLRIGSYNSPHLIHVTERIRLNGRPIDKALFTHYFRHVFDKLKLATQREQVAMPSYFAFLTILAFHIFLEERVDCAIIEVGIGGEYDPTNVLPAPVACAITTLDLDHTNILGNTIKSIAWTKAGIIKPRAPLFTIRHEQPEALESIRTRALEIGSPVVICEPLKTELQKEQLGIKGPAQTLNASLACHLARYFLNSHERRPLEDLRSSSIDHLIKWEDLPESFTEGLMRACLPGRCQIVKCPDVGAFFLDGAHTKKSMENCLEWFTQASGEMDRSATRFLMVNVIGERNKGQVLEPLLKFRHLFNKIIFTSNKVHAAVTSESLSSCDNFSGLQDVANHERSFENVKNNARAWAELTGDCDTETQVLIAPSIMQSLDTLDLCKSLHILATGSLHFVGAMMEALEIRYPNKSNDLH